MWTWLNVAKFAGGVVLGFVAGFVLLAANPIALARTSPPEGWMISSAARGGDGALVHNTQPGLDVRVRCRGTCDDLRVVDIPLPAADSAVGSVDGRRP